MPPTDPRQSPQGRRHEPEPSADAPTGGGWRPLAKLDSLNPYPEGTYVCLAGRELAVFRLPAPHGVVVIDNACPHAGGNLAGGEVERTVVACPWHQWEFDLTTGRCVHNPNVQVRCYEVRVQDGMVQVRLDA